jgi:hypothetical protein
MATAVHPGLYITLAEGQRRLACGRVALLNMIERGLITARSVPGSKPLVLASDVDHIAEASTRRAVSTS